MEQALDSLAADGGTPTRTLPYPPWPHFDDEQVSAAAAVLASGRVNYWTGDVGREYEQAFAEYHGVPHALAVANGTVALELAVLAAGIGPGDEVVVTPRTFIASIAVIVRAGARPVFADVDRDSQNFTPETVAAAITSRTRAIVAVHLAGWPCDMPALMDLADRHGLFVVEDCAQAHGAAIDGKPVGSFGHVAAFSMCQDKIITTGGEGGMVLTADDGLWKRMWAHRDHGKDYDVVHRPAHPPGFRWVHEGFGTNGRLTEMQSRLGLIQLGRLDEWVTARNHHATTIDRVCREIPALRVADPPPAIRHARYKHYVFVRPDRLRAGWDRDRVMEAIDAEGIPVGSGSCSECYLEEAFDASLRPPERLPVARELGETSLMFQVHPTLTDGDVADAATAIQKVMSHASD